MKLDDKNFHSLACVAPPIYPEKGLAMTLQKIKALSENLLMDVTDVYPPVIQGMPAAAHKPGAVTKQLPLTKIAAELRKLIFMERGELQS